MIAGCGFVMITNMLAMLEPIILKNAIDSLRDAISYDALVGYALLIVAIAIAEGVFRFLMRRTIIGVSRHIEYDLRNDYFAHLQTLSQSFYSRFKTGDLMALATNDLEAVRQVVGPAIMYSLNTIVSMSFLGVMLMFDWQLTLLALIPFPLMAVTVLQTARRLSQAHARIQTQYAAITSKVQENIAGIRIVKSYGQEQGEARRFQELNKEFIEMNLGMAKIRGLMMASMSLFAGLGGLIVLWAGGQKVITGDLSLGELVAFFAYLARLTWPMIAAGWVINLFQQGAASLGRLNRVFEIEPDITDGESTNEAVQEIRGEIEFRDVTFAYGEVPVLKAVKLKIGIGQTLAIVGPTGSGKSTLINLIPRLLEPQEGCVLIDGRPVEQIPLDVLRRSIGYVTQDTFLFSDTISSNIRFGNESATNVDIKAAAEASQVMKDIMTFPDQFNTVLGERGINISGGQKQRTAIARAVIRNPRILILDDCFSAVDTYTEDEILKRLRKIMKERTSIIISHRVSTVKDADWIIFFEDGEIKEQGTHDVLLAREGSYAELHERQLLEEVLESY